MNPYVSVIIPIFNRTEMGLRAVRSVLSQSFRDFELIVVNDGSTEDLSQLRDFVERSNGFFIEQSNNGVAAARNAGAETARGRWLAFLDSDDAWEKRKLDAQVLFAKANPAIQICQTEESWIRRGKFVNQKLIHQKPEGEAFFQSLKLCCISPSSVMLTKRLFDESGGFDEDMRVCEDYDLWLRITMHHAVGLIREPLVVKYGGHHDQLSRSVPAMDRFRIYALLKISHAAGLTNCQRRAVYEEIAAKCRILINGATRRGNSAVASLYGDVLASMERQLGAETFALDPFDNLSERLRHSLLNLNYGPTRC